MDYDTSTERMTTTLETITNSSADSAKLSTLKPLPQPMSTSLLVLSNNQAAVADNILIVLGYVIIALSVPLTVCNMVVFLHPAMRSATSSYVVGLSFSQLFYLLSSAGLWIIKAVLGDWPTSLVYWAYYFYISVYMGVVAMRGSYVVMCLVSAERLYAILRPLHVRELCLSKHPIMFMIVTYLVSAVFHVYMLVRTVVDGNINPATGKVVYTLVRTNLYTQHKDINDGFNTASKVLLNYLPLLLQIFLNVLTIIGLRRHNKATKSMQKSDNEDVKQQRERQMTVTILAATISYVVLNLPNAIHSLVTATVDIYNPYSKYSNLFFVVGTATHDLTLFSCGVDFACFVALSSRYRHTLLRIVGVRQKRPTESTKNAETTQREAILNEQSTDDERY